MRHCCRSSVSRIVIHPLCDESNETLLTQEIASTSSTNATSKVAATAPRKSPGPNIAAIAGGSTGGFCVLLLALVCIVNYLRRRRKQITREQSTTIPTSENEIIQASPQDYLYELHQDVRAPELDEQSLCELQEQHRHEVQEHEFSEMEGNAGVTMGVNGHM